MPFPPQRPAFTFPPGIAAGLRAPEAPPPVHLMDGSDMGEEPAPTRADIRTAERTLQAAAGTPVKGGSMTPPTLLKGTTAAELAGPLALMAMRVLEQGMNDYDPRVKFEAARVAATVAPKVVDLAQGEVRDHDPEAERAALLAALATPAFCALLLEVLASPSAPAYVALTDEGWTPPAGGPGA